MHVEYNISVIYKNRCTLELCPHVCGDQGSEQMLHRLNLTVVKDVPGRTTSASSCAQTVVRTFCQITEVKTLMQSWTQMVDFSTGFQLDQLSIL